MSSDNRIRFPWLPVIAVVVLAVGLTVALTIWGHAGDPTETTGQTQPQTTKDVASAEDIVCGEFSSYSGIYVEDGRDELVENVAAMLVTNTSDRYLALATLTYLVDGEEATFKATGIPPGESAWVMEANRRPVTTDAEFERLDCVCSFGEPINFLDQISLQADGNNLIAANQTEETLKDVYVHYKVLHTDGNYLGGITYRVGFGDLEPGSAVVKLAGHYSVDGARIVRVTWDDG